MAVQEPGLSSMATASPSVASTACDWLRAESFTSGEGCAAMLGCPSSSHPVKRTGPASSQHARAAAIGDLPAPLGSTTCPRRHRYRPAPSRAYHQATNRACDWVHDHG